MAEETKIMETRKEEVKKKRLVELLGLDPSKDGPESISDLEKMYK